MEQWFLWCWSQATKDNGNQMNSKNHTSFQPEILGCTARRGHPVEAQRSPWLKTEMWVQGDKDLLSWILVLFLPSCVRRFVTPWTVARQALSMGILQARILEWVAMPSSRGSSWPRDQTQVFPIADSFFTIWATRVNVSISGKYLQPG